MVTLHVYLEILASVLICRRRSKIVINKAILTGRGMLRLIDISFKDKLRKV